MSFRLRRSLLPHFLPSTRAVLGGASGLLLATTLACASTPDSTKGPNERDASEPYGSEGANVGVEESDAVVAKAGPISDAAKAILAADDRTDDDREADERRHPEELLTFIEVGPGMRVADLGAGSGYTTELLARAVTPGGVVYAQNNKNTVEKYVKESWSKRLQREVNTIVVRVDREFTDPLPDSATDLDAVTMIFSYHDVVAAGEDRAQMNAAVFRHLKPGGVYVIADHNAPEGTGLEAASRLHRLREEFIRDEVTAAGFEYAGEAHFLRDPNDKLNEPAFKVGFKTDRYLLKFRKPAE